MGRGHPTQQQTSPRHARPLAVILAVVALLVVLELALQVRSQIRFGRSIFNQVSAGQTVIRDPVTKVRAYRPNALIEGELATIKTNSLGLRSPEIPARPAADEVRLAVIGASTVAGAYAATNEDTFSQILAARLHATYSSRVTNVINGGVEGNGIEDITRIMEHVVGPLSPSVVIIYPGFNNISGYCRGAGGTPAPRKNYGLPKLHLPGWSLAYDLLIKNTMSLRNLEVSQDKDITVADIDTAPFREEVDHLVAVAQGEGRTVVLATVARAFRRDMPKDQQLALSETARYYNHCYSLDSLHDVFDLHNDILRQVAQARGVPVIDLAELIPGGRAYFADSTHFSFKGEEAAADILYQELTRLGILAKVYH